jgi:hypothetical protein
MARFYNLGGGAGGDVSFTEEGCIVFPNDGEVCNVPNSSGDGAGYSTIQINPDTTTNDSRYIILDPTGPNHIHIRAGGDIDQSSADLILGGERNKVHISDAARHVIISTRPAIVINTYTNDNLTSSATFVTSNASDINIGYVVNVGGFDYIVDEIANNVPEEGLLSVAASGASFTAGASYVFTYEQEYDNGWNFNSDGVLSGPAMGLVAVDGIFNNFVDDLYINSSEGVVLDSTSGEFLNDSSIPSNQIATIGDISSTVSEETVFTVNGGTTGTQPTFSGAPLFTGSYIRVGRLVHFQIQIDMDNITSFGTGQYYVDLPFPAKYEYQIRDGCVHDASTSRQYPIGGHVLAGQSRLYLNFIDANGRDDPFTYNTPLALAVADNFHTAGVYIAEYIP